MTGFFYKDGSPIREFDKVIHKGKEFRIIWNGFIGEWVIDGVNQDQEMLLHVAHELEVIQP